jgi:hypothetical protein
MNNNDKMALAMNVACHRPIGRKKKIVPKGSRRIYTIYFSEVHVLLVINTSEVRFAIKGKIIVMDIGRFVTLTRFIGQSVQPENEKRQTFQAPTRASPASIASQSI